MTQPNKDTPAGSIAYGSLSEHASKTEADWRAENKQQLEGQFDQAIQGMVTLLGPIPIIGDLLEIFTGKEDGDYNDFGTAFNRWKNFWGANLKGLFDAVMDALEPVKEFVDGVADVGNQLGQAIDEGVKFVTGGVAFVAGGIAAGLGAIGTALADGLKATQATLENIGKAVFNVPTPQEFQRSVDGARDWLEMATSGLMDLLGINRAKADTAIVNNQLTNAVIYEGWTGVGGSGEVAQVSETVAAIKTEIFKGYTLESLTYNAGTGGGGTWTRPWTTGNAPKEFYVIAFGSGSGGNAGARRTTNNPNETGSSNGGAGGAPGGYIAVEVDAATIPATVSYQVAAGGGGGTQSGGPGGSAQSSFGSYATTQAGQYFVQNLLGYYTTNQSAPGSGGAGGAGYASGVRGTNGNVGGASQIAGGGAAGAGTNTQYNAGGSLIGGTQLTSYTTPTAGSVGGTAPLDQKSRAGGGGGAGGGGAWAYRVGSPGGFGYVLPGPQFPSTPPYEGKLGGNGGFPGGGGGGGGGALTYDSTFGDVGIPAGNGGIGGNGVIILLWR